MSAPDSAPVKRCLVIRIGAHGDAIQASSLFPVLKEMGYRVAVDTSREGEAVLRHDPNIDHIMVSDRNWLKPEDWNAHIKSRAHGYDRVIFLQDATEGELLKMPAQASYHWADSYLRQVCNRNYVATLHEVAGVPFERNQQRFYATPNERAEAQRFKARLGKPLVAWALSGSAQHKIWPNLSRGMVRVLAESDAHIIGLGAPKDKELAESIIGYGSGYHPDFDQRITFSLGNRHIRQAIALAQVADVVVGPETGLLNAVAMEQNAKVLLLSHSTVENLTRDWVNTASIEPDPKRAPCWPCHRMHYDTSRCPQDQATQLSACATSIDVERVVAPILAALRGNSSAVA